MVKPYPPEKIRGGLSKGVAYMRRAMAETKAINKEYRNPTAKNWTYGEFKQTSRDILPSEFVQERIGNVPEDEVVEVPVRRNKYSPDEKYKNLVHRFSYWGFTKDDFKRMPNGDLVEKKYGFLWRPIAYKSPTGESYHWGLRCCRYDSEGNLIPTNKQYEYIYFNRDDPANKDLFSDPNELPPKPVGDLELEANPPKKITNSFEGEDIRLRGYVAKSKGSWRDSKDKPFWWYNQTRVLKPSREATGEDKDAIEKAQNTMERMVESLESKIPVLNEKEEKWADFVANAEPNPRKSLGLKEYNGIRASLAYAREQRDLAKEEIAENKRFIESYKEAIEKNKTLLKDLEGEAPPQEIPGGEELPAAPPRFELAEEEEKAKVPRSEPGKTLSDERYNELVDELDESLVFAIKPLEGKANTIKRLREKRNLLKSFWEKVDNELQRDDLTTERELIIEKLDAIESVRTYKEAFNAIREYINKLNESPTKAPPRKLKKKAEEKVEETPYRTITDYQHPNFTVLSDFTPLSFVSKPKGKQNSQKDIPPDSFKHYTKNEYDARVKAIEWPTTSPWMEIRFQPSNVKNRLDYLTLLWNKIKEDWKILGWTEPSVQIVIDDVNEAFKKYSKYALSSKPPVDDIQSALKSYIARLENGRVNVR